MFGKLDKNQSGPEYVVIGLGNIGNKYDKTRHNNGFDIVDAYVNSKESKWKKKLYHSRHAELKVFSKRVWLLKPTTNMNASGLAVKEIIKRYNIEPNKILVIYDDIDLDVGKLRLRSKGGSGTHNGMRSIISQIDIKEFPRMRIGIGAPVRKDALISHVLGTFSKSDRILIEQTIENAVEAIDSFILNGIDKAMNQFNKA